MKAFSTALLASMCLGQVGLAAAEDIKIGFITTLTTGGAVIGEDQQKAVNLAIEEMGATMGGKSVTVLFEDDGFKPEIGKQAADKLVKEDNVDIVAGFIWSHVLMASYKSVTRANKILISANAGPSPLAGKLCNENFFNVSWQNDQIPMAMGELLNSSGVESVYMMAPNYAAGKDMVAGMERTFTGTVSGKDLTKWGADAQLDFSAELAKAKASGAKGLYAFYPGKAGGAFLNQYQQSGLAETTDLYTVYTIDGLSLPKLQAAGMDGILGSQISSFWSPALDNPANKRFVDGFREKYGSYPSFYAAQAYDSMYLIKSAIDALEGNVDDLDAMRAALLKANFESVRGDFAFGNNHFPIQNFYALEVVANDSGEWTTDVVKTVYEGHQDPHAADCKL